jgi:uncharacterized lipoprotein YbaY
MGASGAGATQVEGRIVFRAAVRAFDNAAVHVYLEDVSFADAAADVVAETVIPGVRHGHTSGDTTVAFVLDLGQHQNIDTRRHYAVRVWVDCDDDGQPSHVDLYSDQVYPVLTWGFGASVTITFEKG